MKEGVTDSPVLLYDGVCGLCNNIVQMILRRDRRRGTMRFAALQSEYGREALSRHPEFVGVDSVIFLQRSPDGKERAYARSNAALRVLSYLGGAWKLLLVLYFVPRPIRDFFYNLIARYRYKIFGKHESCMIPAPEVRSRFLDLAG